MRKHLIYFIITLIPIFIYTSIFCQEKAFIREYTYVAGEMDSKISCRAIATNELRTMLLNEIGVYVESESILKTTEVDKAFSQNFVENISTITAGITKLEILEEKWTGEVFWMRASITVDKQQLEKSLKKIVIDRQQKKQLEDLKSQLSKANDELVKLRMQLKNSDTKKINPLALAEKYNYEINTLTSSEYFLTGSRKLSNEDYKGAERDLSEAIKLNPNYANTYFQRGLAKLGLEDYSGSISDFNKAIQLDPNLDLAYTSRGFVFIKLKKYKKTIQDCTKAIEIYSKSASSYSTRGLAKGYLEDYRGALVDFNNAIKLNPNDALSYSSRGVVKNRLLDYIGAIEDYDKAIIINPNNAINYYNRALVKLQLNQTGGACLDLSKSGELGFHDSYKLISKHCK